MPSYKHKAGDLFTSDGGGLDLEVRAERRTIPIYARAFSEVSLSDDGLETRTREVLTFTDPGSLGLEEVHRPATEEQGNDGTLRDGAGLRQRGVGDHPVKDVPVKWRGRGRDYGLAHRRFLQSTEYQRAVIQIVQGVQSLPWKISIGRGVSAELEEQAREQAAELEASFFELEGGWRRFLGEAVYSLAVPGWGLWLRIHGEDGRLRKLAYRRSSTLIGVYYNDSETKILALELEDSEGESYIVDIRDCLIVSYLQLGEDFEAFTPWRAASEWELASQMLVERYMLSAEKHGTPQDIVEAAPGYTPGEDDAETVARALDYRSGSDPESIIMPPGLTAKTLSPSGMMPPFLEWIRLAGEMKSLTLSAEGALYTGTSGAGSYAALEMKDDQGGRVVIHFAEMIAEAVNGTSNTPYSGPLRTVVDAYHGGPVGGVYPVLGFIPDESEIALTDILAAIQAGAVELTPEVKAIVHERLRLPPPVQGGGDDDGAELEGPAADLAALSPSGGDTVALGSSVYDRILEAAGFHASCDHGPAESELALAERAVSEYLDALPLAEQLELFKKPITPEAAEGVHDATNAKIGRAFDKIAREHRSAWVERSSGLSGVALANLRDQFRGEYLPRYRAAALEPVQELRQKGGLSIAAEMGLIPKIPANATGAALTEDAFEIADALALKSYNITESYLLERARLESNGMPEAKFPPIPDKAIYAKHAATVTGSAFALGRQAFVDSLVEAAQSQSPTGKPPKIIAEYSSVLEASTCDPCAALDGRRFFLGSSSYERYKPPSVCEGGNRCRCIMTYLGSEDDFASIYEELERGFSQTGNAVNFSDGAIRGELLTAIQVYRGKDE